MASPSFFNLGLLSNGQFSLIFIISFFSFHFFYSPELTSECQFGLRFDFVTLVYLIHTFDARLVGIRDFLKIFNLTKLSSSFQRSFWSFYRVQDPLSFCIPISDKKTNIWCNVSCDVWLCTNEMSEHFFEFFFSFFHFNECEMQMSYANAMIGLTNALCNHCAQICYWQTPNYYPRYPFSMNANK